jgi:hypothetical protein
MPRRSWKDNLRLDLIETRDSTHIRFIWLKIVTKMADSCEHDSEQ